MNAYSLLVFAGLREAVLGADASFANKTISQCALAVIDVSCKRYSISMNKNENVNMIRSTHTDDGHVSYSFSPTHESSYLVYGESGHVGV